MATKICNHCLQEKDESEFNWRYKYMGVRSKTCRACAHDFNKAYYEGDVKENHLQDIRERKAIAREMAKEYVYQYLLTHPCESCGQTDPRVLEFHHVGGKDMAITTMTTAGYSIRRIQDEISKCQVLCANCHRIVTSDERGWFRSRK